MRSHITSSAPVSLSKILFALVLGAVVVFSLGVYVGVNPPDTPTTTTTTQVCPQP